MNCEHIRNYVVFVFSPHTCGAVSLLLSGLKSAGVAYSPFSVKRALANTARPLRNHCQYAQGHGLLQVGKGTSSELPKL